MQQRMGHLIESQLSLASPSSAMRQRALRRVAPGLLLIRLLAAFGPLICTLLCHSAPAPAVSASASINPDALAFLQTPRLPGLESPVKPGSAHCARHHSCCQMGLLLSAVGLAPLLVLVALHLAKSLAVLQTRFAPTTPPPQFVCC